MTTSINTKKRVQVQVDSSLLEQSEYILDALGLNVTTYLNMSLKRLTASNGLPFTTSLTEQELSDKLLFEAINQLPAKSSSWEELEQSYDKEYGTYGEA